MQDGGEVGVIKSGSLKRASSLKKERLGGQVCASGGDVVSAYLAGHSPVVVLCALTSTEVFKRSPSTNARSHLFRTLRQIQRY